MKKSNTALRAIEDLKISNERVALRMFHAVQSNDEVSWLREVQEWEQIQEDLVALGHSPCDELSILDFDPNFVWQPRSV